MEVSSRSGVAGSATIVPPGGGVLAHRWALRLQGRVALAVATLVAVAICGVHAVFAGMDTKAASAPGYLCLTVVLFGCSLAFWTRSRAAQGTLAIRWSLIAAGSLAASIGYLPSFTEAALGTGPCRLFQIACFNACEALYMLAAVLFFAGVARSIVIVDMLQALLFVVLRFNLIYSSATQDHFRINHLFTGQLVALFLFLVSVVACLGATSRAELMFLRTLSWFFGIRLVSFFLANQVSYVWLHHRSCGFWDLPGPALFASFALYLLYTGKSATVHARDNAPIQSRSMVVRSLMPSFLALVNLMLGLFLLPVTVPLAAVAISLSLVCYVLRTGLLQGHAVHEKALLESRNEQLEGLAIRDPLTGIGNRRSLAGAYARLQASAGESRVALLAIDIDSFKQANDLHGHLHGDAVLVALARRLESLAAGAAGSHCARLGGDEFAVLLPDVTCERASVMAEELRVIFREHRFAPHESRATLSIGVASLPAVRSLPLETLIRRADEALYRAKQMGRDRVKAMPEWEAETAAEDGGAAPLRFELQHTAS